MTSISILANIFIKYMNLSPADFLAKVIVRVKLNT